MSGVVVRAKGPSHPLTQAEAEDWADVHLPQQTPDIGLCAAVLRGEVLGVFRTPREATAAMDRRLAELAAQGHPLRHGDDAGTVVFVDPAYHVPQTEGRLNG